MLPACELYPTVTCRYGLREFVVITPGANCEAVISESKCSLLLSSVSMCLSNSGWQVVSFILFFSFMWVEVCFLKNIPMKLGPSNETSHVASVGGLCAPGRSGCLGYPHYYPFPLTLFTSFRFFFFPPFFSFFSFPFSSPFMSSLLISSLFSSHGYLANNN